MKRTLSTFIGLLIGSITLSGCSCSHHTHDFSIDKYDDEYHWQECECGKKANKKLHDLTYSGNKDQHWKVCGCGYESETKENHHFLHTYDDSNHFDICQDCKYQINIEAHTHNGYDYDDTRHWKVCDCGHNDYTYEPHSFTEKVMTEEYLKEAATASTPNVFYYSCVCGVKGTETFTSGLPLNHEHTYDYKGNCTSEYCDHSIQKEIEYGDIGAFSVGPIVFKMYLPIVGLVKLIADFTSLENEAVKIYKEDGTLLTSCESSRSFTNDKAQTLYFYTNPKHDYGYITFVCDHQLDYTGHCTQCDDYDVSNELTLGEQTEVMLMYSAPTYMAFTAPYSGLFEIVSVCKTTGNPARYASMVDSDGNAADYSFGNLVATKDETYYFTAYYVGAGQQDTYTFTVNEVKDDVTAYVNSVSVSGNEADLFITIVDGSITRGQRINLITNNGATTEYIVSDVATDSHMPNYNVIDASSANNHITIKDSSLSSTEKNMLITSQETDEFIDSLYFNYRMFSVAEIGENIAVSDGARLILDAFGNQTFTPVGTVSLYNCPTTEGQLNPSEGCGVEIKFAYDIPSNLFVKGSIYNVFIRFNGTYKIGECAVVDSEAIAESITYFDEINYQTDKIAKGYVAIRDRCWKATIGKTAKYNSTITLTDEGKSYYSSYLHSSYHLFLGIISMEDSANGLRITYEVIYNDYAWEDIDYTTFDELWLIDTEETKFTEEVSFEGDNCVIFPHLTMDDTLTQNTIGIAY